MASTEYQTGDGASANNYSQHQDRFFLEDFDVWQNFTAPQADENEAILYQYEPTNEGHTEDTHEALSAEDIWRRIRTKQNGEFSEDFDELSSSNSLNVVYVLKLKLLGNKLIVQSVSFGDVIKSSCQMYVDWSCTCMLIASLFGGIYLTIKIRISSIFARNSTIPTLIDFSVLEKRGNSSLVSG